MDVSICQLRTVTSEWSPGFRTYSVYFRVDVPSELWGPNRVRSALGKILNGETYTYSDGAFKDFDPTAVLVKINTPRRAGSDKLKNKWIVQCEYEFDQSQRPEYQGVKVEPFFQQGSEPIPKTKFLGVFQDIGGTLQPVDIPAGQETFTVGNHYPISNSAGVPILPAPERDKTLPSYRVKWYTRRSDFYYTPFLNTFNESAFRLLGTAITSLSPIQIETNIKFDRVFPAKTMRLANVQFSEAVFYGYTWYEVALEFIEESQVIYELDRGFTARAKVGDSDGRGGTYSIGDFPDGSSGQRDILDPDGNPVPEPVLLNGRGKPLDEALKYNARYMGFEKYPVSDFSQLPIGVL